MSRKKQDRYAPSSAWAPPGATGKDGDAYTVTLDLASEQDPEVEIKVRPQSDAIIGNKQPFRGKLKLLPAIDMGDVGPPSTYSFLAKQIVTVIEKKIMTDNGGDYALIRVKANRRCALGDAPFRDAKTSRIWVEVKTDMGKGATTGIRGETTINLQLNEWKVTFNKTLGMWREQKDVNLTAVPNCDRQCLAQIGRYGGTIDVSIDGGIKLGAYTLWNEKKFKDAMLLLWGSRNVQMKGDYIEAEDVYRFEVPGKMGPTQGPKTLVRMEVWIDNTLQNRLTKLVSVVRDLQKIVGGELEADAEKFIQQCIDILAAEDGNQLGAREKSFKQATHAAVFFHEFTLQTAKGFKLTLDTHNEIYERYMQNLVALVMEVLFLCGEGFFHKVFGRVIKHGKAEAEKIIKSEAKTIAHEAVEDAQAALKPKLDTAHAALEQTRTARRGLADATRAGISKSEELVETIAKQTLEQTEKTQAKEALENGAEALSKEIDALRRAGLSDNVGTVSKQLEQVAHQLEKNSTDLTAAMSKADMLAESLKHAPEGPSQMVTAMEAAFKKADADVKALQKVANGLSATEGQLQNMSRALTGLQTKEADAKKLTKELVKLEEKIIASNRALQGNQAAVESQVQQFVKGLKDQGAKEAEIASLRVQEKLLADIKDRAAHGTEAEFKAALQTAMQNLPTEEEIRLSIANAMKTQGGVEEVTKSLKAWEKGLTEMETRASADLRPHIEKGLLTVRQALQDIGMMDQTYKAIVAQYIGWTADYIKGKFNERAKKLRELLEQLMHSDYKAIPAEYYDNTYWGQACAFADFLWQDSTGWWNWFWSFVPSAQRWAEHASTSKDWGPWLAGNSILYMGQFSFACLTFLVVLVDRILQLIMKALEAILYIANSPNLAHNRLTEEASKNALDAPHGMPAHLPDEFFAFSGQMIVAVAERVDPKRIANESGGKASISAGIKQEFAGAYREYYEPQWERACTFMAKLAGAQGALDPGWLDSNEVRAEQRQVLQVLATILKPMEKYHASFARGERTGTLTTDLVGLKDDYFKGQWSPHDLDVMYEKIGDAMSLLIKFTGAGLLIGGLLFGAVPVVLAGGAVMVAGGVSDFIAAAMRTTVTAVRSMPDVLGAMFDVMKVYSLGYQEVYRTLDLTDVIRSEEIPNWIKERGGPFGIYG